MSNKFEVPSLGNFDMQLQLSTETKTELLNIYKDLLRIRIFEHFCADRKREGEIGGPVHLAVGQEAIATGLSKHLTKNDFVFSAHRSHAHLLALGGNMRWLFAELLGRSKGFSGGFGGSMHLVDIENGFHGSVPIVSGTVPIAVGAAHAVKYKNSDSIAVSYFGDGALEEGVVQEALNLASLMELPILFICENNLMASHMHLSQRQKNEDLTRFASANSIPAIRIDGNNVLEISRKMDEVVKRMRIDRKPFFVEAITYRQLGHVDWREDIDVGVNRSLTELAKWKEFDPILRLRSSLISNNIFTISELEKLEIEISHEVGTAWKEALQDELPTSEEILLNVFASEKSDKNV